MYKTVALIFTLIVTAVTSNVPQPVYITYLPIVEKAPHKAGAAWAWYGHRDTTDPENLKVGWFLTWAPTTPRDTNGMEWVPCLACDGPPYYKYDALAVAVADLGADYKGYMLWLNEPRITGQCVMTPMEAVQFLGEIRTTMPYVTLIGPNMSHVDYLAGWVWLREFRLLALIYGVRLPEIGGVHTYWGNAPAQSLLDSYFEQPYSPTRVWVTEFGHCDPIVVADMLETWTNDPRVDRYAYFAPRLYMDVVPPSLRCLGLIDESNTLNEKGVLFRDIR